MSDDGGVTPSQETNHVSPTEVTPELGKGALDTWRSSRSYGGRPDKTGVHAGYGFRRRGCGQTRSGRGVYEPAFKPLQPWKGLRMICQGFKPDPGNLAVRHYRGASRNVRHGETVNPSCNRKSGNGNPSPTAGRARSLSQPWTMEKAKRARKAETLKQPSLSLRLRAPYLYPDRDCHPLAKRETQRARAIGALGRSAEADRAQSDG